jgi:uncharacterized protein (DUF58 family)
MTTATTSGGPGVAAAPIAAGTPPPPVAAEILRRLELTLGRRVDGLLHGDHEGRVPGLGTEAGESRPYAAGDDPRRMDWNVTARTQAPHVRDAIAEREVESWLVVDLSPSTDFGTAGCTKRDLVVGAAGALALLASRAGDGVGAHVLTHRGIATLPPRAGGAHGRALLDALAAAPRVDRDGDGPTRPRCRRRPRAARPRLAAPRGGRRRVGFPGNGRVGARTAGGRRPPRDVGGRGA